MLDNEANPAYKLGDWRPIAPAPSARGDAFLPQRGAP